MSNTFINMKILARLGMQWFASPPEGYSFPNNLAKIFMAFSSSNRTPREFEEFTDFITKSQMEDYVIMVQKSCVTLRDWLEDNGPTMFVEPELAEFCMNTDVGDTVRCTDVRPVYQSGCFVLPDNIDCYINDMNIRYIFFSTRTPEQHNLDRDCGLIWEPNDDISEIETELSCVCFSDNKGYYKTAFCLGRDITINEHNDVLQKLSSTKAEVFRDINNMIVSLFLSMQCLPLYKKAVSSGRRSRMNTKKDVGETVILGRSAKKSVRQIVDESDRVDLGGTHSSPHSHWRRAHWRRQSHGDRWQLANSFASVLVKEDGSRYHMKRIEGMFVGDAVPR